MNTLQFSFLIISTALFSFNLFSMQTLQKKACIVASIIQPQESAGTEALIDSASPKTPANQTSNDPRTRMQAAGLPHSALDTSLELKASLKNNDFESCKSLIQQNPAILQTHDNEGKSPLHCAVTGGMTNCLQFLIDAGASVDAVDANRQTPLHYAAALNSPACLQVLLDNHANTKASDTNDLTPFLWAASKGKSACLRMLMPYEYKSWESPARALNIALANGHALCVQILLNHGARLNMNPKEGKTSLYIAAKLGRSACLKILLTHNAFVDELNKDGRTALHVAARQSNTECLQILLNHNANVEATTSRGNTALHMAAAKGNVACLQILLNHKANVEALNNEKMTPLHAAALNSSSSCLQMLLKHKVNIEAADEKGETALLMAAKGGRAECLQALLQHGANIEACDRYGGYAALHWAARAGQTECLQILLNHKANIEATCKRRGTALHYAAVCGRTDCVGMLLNHGASNVAILQPNHTPLSLALQQGHFHIAKMLFRAQLKKDMLPLCCILEGDIVVTISDQFEQLTQLKSLRADINPAELKVPLPNLSLEVFTMIEEHIEDLFVLDSIENHHELKGEAYKQCDVLAETFATTYTQETLQNILQASHYLDFKMLRSIAMKAFALSILKPREAAHKALATSLKVQLLELVQNNKNK